MSGKGDGSGESGAMARAGVVGSADSGDGSVRAYLVTKARRYLEVGPARYRGSDALGRPEADMHPDFLVVIRRAFEQLAEQRGATATAPLEGVGIRGLYAAMHVAHFARVAQAAFPERDGRFVLDRIDFVHEVTPHLRQVLWNRVELPVLGPEPDEGPARRARKRPARASAKQKQTKQRHPPPGAQPKNTQRKERS